MSEKYTTVGLTHKDYWDKADKRLNLGDVVKMTSKTTTGSDTDPGLAILVKKYQNFFLFENVNNKQLTYSIHPIDCLNLEIINKSNFSVRSTNDAINDIFDAFN